MRLRVRCRVGTDLSVEDVAERPEQRGEGRTVETHQHHVVARGGDRGHAWLRLEQGHLAKVVAW